MVEFALVLPIFLVLVFGTLDLGRAVFLQSQLTLTVQEATRKARVMAGSACSAVPIQQRVTARPGLGAATVACNPGGALSSGSSTTMTATLPFQMAAAGLFPGIPAMTLSATARVEVE